jgi:mannitol/fructose-specific phosphotransferase system IIA component (Ntr-type)
MSTCLGSGLMVPHGDLPEGSRIIGAMGLSRDGLNFETPDDRSVHCIVLLATPPSEREHHLEVLAALARTIGHDDALQHQLFTARSPAHAAEILHAEEAEGLNYFLDPEAKGT